MSRKLFMLDTSAILTLIEDEDGAERVEEVIKECDILIHATALMEVYYITFRGQYRAEADRRYALLKALSAIILWEIDEPTLLTAARLKASYPLSLADAMIAAAAIQHQAILLHKDPEYEAIHEEVSLEQLPYKSLLHEDSENEST